MEENLFGNYIIHRAFHPSITHLEGLIQMAKIPTYPASSSVSTIVCAVIMPLPRMGMGMGLNVSTSTPTYSGFRLGGQGSNA